jgi:hypothetical protein
VPGIVHRQVSGGAVSCMTALAPVPQPNRQRLREGRLVALRSHRPRGVAPPHAADSGLRAEVERTREEDHLGARNKLAERGSL